MKADVLQKLRKAGFNVPKFIVLPCNFDFNSIDLETQLLDFFSNDTLFAVRSSSGIEDSSAFSYAGQFETKLNVSISGIRDAYSEVVKSYGDCIDEHSNVIIQEMVNSEYSGVLFTANPQGIYNEMVIVVGNGLGENVVEDKVKTTTYYYNIDDKLYTVNKTGNSTELPVNILDKLVKIGADIELLLGYKVDIEFALVEGEIFILQARPITTLDTSNLIVLDNSNIVESYPGISLPLTQDFVQNMYYRVFKSLVYRVTLSDKVVEQLDPVLREMTAVVNGRIYYKISNWYAVLQLLPMKSKMLKIWQQMMGVKNTSIMADKVEVSPYIHLYVLFGVINCLNSTPKNMDKLNEYFKKKYSHYKGILYKMKLSGASVEDYLNLYKKMEYELSSVWDITLLNDLYTFVYTFLSKSFGNSAISDIKGLESMKPVEELNKLIDLYNLLGENSISFKEHFDTYIELYGDRCLQELKLETITYRRNPDLLLNYIKTHEPVELNHRGNRSTSFIDNRAKLGIKNREISRLNRSRIFGLMREVFVQIGLIWVNQGYLNSVNDVFYLHMDELTGLGFTAGVASIKDRKEIYERFETYPCHNRLVFMKEVFDIHNDINHILSSESNSLYGVGTSEGIVEGEVIVLDKPSLDIDTSDKIIVTKMTDPGWVFLIKNAVGIIAEQGSLLSHTAIISRELHKPAVVNVSNVMHRLKTGDKVRINGTTGVIEKL